MAVINAENLVMGRMASHVAKRLLNGEEIHIVNAEKALITGRRDSILERFKFKREVGTRRKGPFYPRAPHMIVKRTVRGMISYQSGSGRAAYRRLRVHIGVPTELGEAPVETIDKAKTQAVKKITVGEVARWMGAKF